MQVSINIKVRNPEWYWEPEMMKDKKNEMPRKEWEMINEKKVAKYSETVDFEFSFDIEKYSDNRESSFELIFYNENQEKHSYNIENVTVVEFSGDNKKSFVVVSNDLIHQFIGAKKQKGKYYWYFYIKENLPYFRLSDNIWLSESQYDKNLKQFESLFIKEDPNLKIRNESRLISVNNL